MSCPSPDKLLGSCRDWDDTDVKCLKHLLEDGYKQSEPTKAIERKSSECRCLVLGLKKIAEQYEGSKGISLVLCRESQKNAR